MKPATRGVVAKTPASDQARSVFNHLSDPINFQTIEPRTLVNGGEADIYGTGLGLNFWRRDG